MRASTSERRSRAKGALLVAATGIALAGCIAAVREVSRAPRFDHSHHVKKGLDCADCHATATTTAAAAMPDGASCRDCHGKDDTLEVAAVVSAYETLAPEARHRRPSTYLDVRFDHARHAAAKLSCNDCHSGATTGAAPNPDGPLTMARCQACHDEKGGPTKRDCRGCHEVWSNATKPRDHDRLWLSGHGPQARLAKDNVTVASAEQCNLCHSQSSCDQCHRRDAPRDHNQTWRTATHGLQASIDRSRCATCHTKDSCDRCHKIEPPRSHTANFGAPRDTHCLGCHEPLGDSGCAVCHKGAPQHRLAAPKPAGHVATMNCRQCHGAGQPLPHVDNGTECNACHH